MPIFFSVQNRRKISGSIQCRTIRLLHEKWHVEAMFIKRHNNRAIVVLRGDTLCKQPLYRYFTHRSKECFTELILRINLQTAHNAVDMRETNFIKALTVS
ncbi:hypothetical protein FQZ97_1078820 [compost metagenome]